ncbi:hypothetical protein SAMN04487884_10744 [Butyrivibrio fibrisolvens]|uniref:SGNH/GDSL hydrolase family protein n=1 Tax=Butyrivibrio fibrisolvens TaxID=831 RepID=A0A1H9Q5K2_BUTFI|nr:hypothetical protein [Butyrivibrio fibrisolvens]SER55730.1 hypothetical protein SAMN04487884_10744 [Butyrivibrio fibrisolvens]
MIKTKKAVSFIVRALALIAISAIIMQAVFKVVQRKESYEKYADFFDVADQIDVLYLGSPHVINGVNPVQIFEQYGYTGYNMGGHGSVMPSTYWELMLALEYCNPKVVFVDTYMLEKNYQYIDVMDEDATADELNTSVEQLHLNMDCWPYSDVKKAAIEDLIYDEDLHQDFLFDFELYHERWTELDRNDFLRLNGTGDRNLLMGAEQRTKVHGTYTLEDKTEGLSQETVSMQYLRKLIEECQSRGIVVVTMILPLAELQPWDMAVAASTEQISAEYGIPCLNMIQDTSIVNLYTDLNDSGHLNAGGMNRVSAYLGKWLYDNESQILTDHRGASEYSRWSDRVIQMHEAESSIVESSDNAYSALLSLYDETTFDYIVYVKGNSSAYGNVAFLQLIEELSGTTEVETAAAVGGPYLLLHGVADGIENLEICGDQQPAPFGSKLGNITYLGLPDFAAIYVNDDTQNNLLDMNEHYNDDVQILLINRETGQVYSHLCFSL